MNKLIKKIIEVPKGIRFLSEWKEFSLDMFGNNTYIIDKQIPGCGFTEYCLTSSDNLILCSPRKILLENKENQHPGEILYARNESDVDLVVDKDISGDKGVKLTEEESTMTIPSVIDVNIESLNRFKERINEYCLERSFKRMPKKIIVTYDSFRYIKRAFYDLYGPSSLDGYKIVIDEFQSIFIDSHFKPETEIRFLSELVDLYGRNNICMVSATPMLDEYLIRLEEFKGLPYYELDWAKLDPKRVCSPDLVVRQTRSMRGDIRKIIDDYRSGNFKVLPNPIDNSIVQSKEAVFYLNSVKEILTVIKSNKILPDEVNILCADSEVNRKQMKKKLGVKYHIGSVPLRGEPHKMFTFCTRTVYLGADFYSTNARTFVFSNANIDSLSVDISLDLPQILGRQRLIENPWKNKAEFYFRPLGNGKVVDRSVFDRRLKEKTNMTENLLVAYSNTLKNLNISVSDALLFKYWKDIFSSTYKDDYLSINYIEDEKSYKPVFNNLVFVSEQRAFDIQQIDYKDRFTVFNTIQDSKDLSLNKLSEVYQFLADTRVPFSKRLQYLCETPDLSPLEKETVAREASESFDKFYNILGPARCRALGYHITRLGNEISNLLIPTENIKDKFLDTFKPGDKYSKVLIKNKIGEIYEELGLKKNPKASDLENYFNIRLIKVKDDSGNWINGFEIISIRSSDLHS